MKKIILYFIVPILALLGFVTLFLSLSIILNLFDIRAMEGNYVPFVVWANFICSLLYLVSTYGFIKNKSWTSKLLAFSALVLVAAYAGMFFHINAGGLYETKTLAALPFRISITLVFALVAFFTINKRVAQKK